MDPALRRYHISPFDTAASRRRKHMGLLLPDGRPDQTAVSAIAHVYAGLFYGHLREERTSRESADAVCQDLIDRAAKLDARQKVLALCGAYDALYIALPEPVWWMSGDLALASLFVEKFLEWLSMLMEETEVM